MYARQYLDDGRQRHTDRSVVVCPMDGDRGLCNSSLLFNCRGINAKVMDTKNMQNIELETLTHIIVMTLLRINISDAILCNSWE